MDDTIGEIIQPQEPSTPPPPPPPLHDRDRSKHKRKLYQSCDYCRKRRRACDAAHLGLDSFAQNTSKDETRPTACTNCQKAQRECTFEWLRSLPTQNLPRGVKSRLGLNSYTAQEGSRSDGHQRFVEDTLPEARTTPGDRNLLGALEAANMHDFRQGASSRQQYPSVMSHATTVGFTEHDSRTSFSANPLQNENSGFSTNLLDDDFHTPWIDDNDEVQHSTQPLRANYSSRTRDPSDSYTDLQVTELGQIPNWEPLAGQMDVFPDPSVVESPTPNYAQTSFSTLSGVGTTPDRQLVNISAPHNFFNVPWLQHTSESTNTQESSNRAGARGHRERQPKIGRSNFHASCRDCHKNQILCDGKWPACTPCSKLGIACQYFLRRSDKTSDKAVQLQLNQLQQELQQHADVLEQLRSLPESEAVTIIRWLRSTRDPSSVLSSIKGSASTQARVSEIAVTRGTLPPTDSGAEFELSMSYPSIYLASEPLDLNSINLGSVFSSILRKSPFGLSSAEAIGSHTYRQVSSNMLQTNIFSPPSSHEVNIEGMSPTFGPVPKRQYCDSRLDRLNIGYWTKINISDELAACVISNYLESEHLIFACFDTDLFLSDLVDLRLDYCSPLLLNALMSFACQVYSGFDIRSAAFAGPFMQDSEMLLQAEQNADSSMNLAAMCYLAMAALISGNDLLSTRLSKKSYNMGLRMNLFGVPATDDLVMSFQQFSSEQMKEYSHAAWGAYSWLSIRSAYFADQPINFQPILPIPGDTVRLTGSSMFVWPPHPLPSYMGQTFSTLCKLWVIFQEIQSVYSLHDSTPLLDRVSLAFAEFKYRRLLAWADKLPEHMLRREHDSSHNLLFQGLYHSIVLDLFRPFLVSRDQRGLNTFSSTDATPSSIFFASLNQLKHIIYVCCKQPPHPRCPLWFNSPVVQVSFAIIRYRSREPQWYFYYLLCFRFWKHMFVRYSAFETVALASLTFALRSNAISSRTATKLIEELRSAGNHQQPSKTTLSCLLDLDLAIENLDESRMDRIAEQYEEQLFINELSASGTEVDT